MVVEGVVWNCTEIIPFFWLRGPDATCSGRWKGCKCSPGDLAVPTAAPARERLFAGSGCGHRRGISYRYFFFRIVLTWALPHIWSSTCYWVTCSCFCLLPGGHELADAAFDKQQEAQMNGKTRKKLPPTGNKQAPAPVLLIKQTVFLQMMNAHPVLPLRRRGAEGGWGWREGISHTQGLLCVCGWHTAPWKNRVSAAAVPETRCASSGRGLGQREDSADDNGAQCLL